MPTHRLRLSKAALGRALLFAGIPGLLSAIELQTGTLNAWDDYIRKADSRMQARLASRQPFLWIDEDPNRARRLRGGEVVIAPVNGRATQCVPNGLIHDWIGAVFLRNATIETLFAVIHDYDRYKEFYKPFVADSRVINCSESEQRFSMIWKHRVLFITAVIEGQYRMCNFVLDTRRGYSIADTASMQEIENYGEAGERYLPPGQGNGFMWRLHSIGRYEERDGGVYIESEVMALTRDIPVSLRWLVSPLVNRLSMNSLETSMRQTRDAVNVLLEHPGRPTSCVIDRRSFGTSNRPARNREAGADAN